MVVIGNQDVTEVLYNGVRLEVLSMLRFVLWSFGLRQHVNWQVVLTRQLATLVPCDPFLIPFFYITSHFFHYDSVTI